MVEGIAGVDEIRWPSLMPIAQEASLNNLDVVCPRLVDLGAQRLQHHWRYLDGDDPRTDCCRWDGELAGPRPDIDDDRLASQAEFVAEPNFVGGACVLLRVVARHMADIKVLATGAGTSSSSQPGTLGSRTDNTDEHRASQPPGPYAYPLTRSRTGSEVRSK
jgi:hypothetical protein